MSKFLPGNNANPKGRPKTAFKEDFDNLLAKKKMHDQGVQIVSETWEEIIHAMAHHAIRGNVQAAIFLRDTFIGKPKETIDHGTTSDAGIKILISKPENDL